VSSLLGQIAADLNRAPANVQAAAAWTMGEGPVVWFLLLTTAIGVVVALSRHNWMMLALVGAVLLPLGVAGLVAAGSAFWPALGQTFIGLVAMQAAFLVSGWALDAWRRRADSLSKQGRRPPRAGES
jgi:hypothetical protein